jgi:prepilin-type processing-associated H-X9-DG protein
LLLPVLEETNLSGMLNFELPIENAANTQGVTTALPMYLCPSDTREPVWAAMSQSGNTKICDVAEAAYVGMFGTTEPGIDGNGLFFRNSTVHIREITDGTSQPIAVGERAELLGEATWVGSVTGAYLAQDPNDNDGIGIFEQEEGSTMVLGQSGEGKSPGDPTGEPDMFFSMHPGGVNFVFADGHVTFLTNEMDPQLFEDLSTRAGGEVIPSGSSF